MDLRLSADECEDAAAGFSTFRAPLPEHATEVTALMSDFYALSSTLGSLADLIKDPRYRRNWPLVQGDLELVRLSLKYTIEDILDFFGRLDGGKATQAGYKRVWLDLTRFFWEESQYTLGTRLAQYKTFLRELGDLMKDRGHDLPLIAGYRASMKSLMASQEQRVAARFARMSLGRNPPSSDSTDPPSPVSDRRPRRRSFERSRPPHLSPQSPLSPLSPASNPFFDIPAAPEAPHSPDALSSTMTGSTSTTTATTQSTHSDAVQYHWIKEAFTNYGPGTPLPDTSDKAGCFGEPQSAVKAVLKEQGFEQLLQLAFNDPSNMTIYFFLRERDHRVRIVIKIPRRSKPNEYFCLPLNMLEILREGSCLQLCRRRRAGTQLVLWATLKFTTIESMVVFFTTFLALRSQDSGRPVDNIRDHEMEDEEELYGGQILDDTYRHALRIYHDTVSGAIRLQASVHLSEMDRTPVWTAFITPHLSRRGWLRRLDNRTVLVRDLRPIILMSAEDYNPPVTSRGEHILTFTSSDDAESFLGAVEDATLTLLT